MTNTFENKQNDFKSECKLINLKYEYQGYTGDEQWAIVSELTEQEIFLKYPEEAGQYVPFVLLSVEQGEVIKDYIQIEDRYRKRQVNNEDAFGYDDDLTQGFHNEAAVPDFIEQQEIDEYYQMRAELKMELLAKAIASLTEKQKKYLTLRYLYQKSAREIAREEGIAHQVIDRHILAGVKKFEKIFGDFLRK